MKNTASSLCERLKQLGYAKNQKLRMYGEEFDLLSDPHVIENQVVVVNAVAKIRSDETLIDSFVSSADD